MERVDYGSIGYTKAVELERRMERLERQLTPKVLILLECPQCQFKTAVANGQVIPADCFGCNLPWQAGEDGNWPKVRVELR